MTEMDVEQDGSRTAAGSRSWQACGKRNRGGQDLSPARAPTALWSPWRTALSIWSRVPTAPGMIYYNEERSPFSPQGRWRSRLLRVLGRSLTIRLRGIDAPAPK
jgi:hypothetical protein